MVHCCWSAGYGGWKATEPGRLQGGLGWTGLGMKVETWSSGRVCQVHLRVKELAQAGLRLVSRWPPKPHVIIGRAFSEVAGLRVYEPRLDSWCNARHKGIGINGMSASCPQ